MAEKKTKKEAEVKTKFVHIINPRVTEKSSLATTKSVYTFNILPGATKEAITKEIKNLYKVTVRKVAIVNLPKKKVFFRGGKGTKGGARKAIVYLKKGESIEFA
jgi:ribosomal protein L23